MEEFLLLRLDNMNFDHFPSFAELWGTAVKTLYSESDFGEELIAFLKQNNLSKSSNLADVAAGEGFPAIYMRKKGFEIDCFDLSDDQIALFKENALKRDVSPKVIQSSWLELAHKTTKSYDFIMCRGNSFIYAPGGWNSNHYNRKEALQIYKETLKVFYKKLSPNGILFIDKFKDSEVYHETQVCRISVLDKPYNLIFNTRLDFDNKERYATLFLEGGRRKKETFPNLTYALSDRELIKIAEEIGFSIEKINFKSEKNFDIFILRKA